MQRFGIKLHRTGRRECKLATVAINLAVGKAEGIPGKDVPRARIVYADVVSRVPGRIEKAQFAAVEFYAVIVRRLDDAFIGDRDHHAVHAQRLLLSVHPYCSFHQPARVRNVAGTPGVYREFCVRQPGHQQSGAPGMIQVDVGEDNEIHIIGAQPLLLQGFQHQRNGAVRRRVDDCDAPVFDDDVHGTHQAAIRALRVDGTDAVRVIDDVCHDRGPGLRPGALSPNVCGSVQAPPLRRQGTFASRGTPDSPRGPRSRS